MVKITSQKSQQLLKEEPAEVNFDAGSLPEMCETARVVTDELMIREMINQALVDNLTSPIVEAVYDELMIHENFEELPPFDEMSDLIARALAILMPDLVKRVFQNALGVPRD